MKRFIVVVILIILSVGLFLVFGFIDFNAVFKK